MSENIESLNKRIESVGKLQSVVKTMKTLAASQVRQLEKAEKALEDYEGVLNIALLTMDEQCPSIEKEEGNTAYIVWGSDQGLVGQFNDQLKLRLKDILNETASKKFIFAIGEKLEELIDQYPMHSFLSLNAPGQLEEVTPLLERVLDECAKLLETQNISQIFLLYQTPDHAHICLPKLELLFPLNLPLQKKWPGKNIPEVCGDKNKTWTSLKNEYLFLKLSKTCVNSLTSENLCRLSAMQRAEKNIEEVLEELHTTHHRVRQNMIDAELFDILSGFESA